MLALIPLLDKDNYQSLGFCLLERIPCPFGGRILYSLYHNQDYLVCQSEQPASLVEVKEQLLIPKSAIHWIMDSIKNGFWRRPDDGGLAKNIHFVTRVFGEDEIIIRRNMNAGVEGEMGFTVLNKSKTSYIVDWNKQMLAFSDKLLADHLFPIMETL